MLDASVAVAWVLDDEPDSRAQAAFERAALGDFVPRHRPTEVANALRSAERSGRLTLDGADARMRALGEFGFVMDEAPWAERLIRTLDLSRRYDLTVYDAAYPELAERKGVPLATLDRALLAVLAKPEFTVLRFEL